MMVRHTLSPRVLGIQHKESLPQKGAWRRSNVDFRIALSRSSPMGSVPVFQSIARRNHSITFRRPVYL